MKAPSGKSPSARTTCSGVDNRRPSNKIGERPRCLFIVRAESTRDGAPLDHQLTGDPLPARGDPDPHGPRPRILGPRSVGDRDVHDRSPTRRRGRLPLRGRPGRRPRRAHPGARWRGDREHLVHETRESGLGVPRRPPRRGGGLRSPRRPSPVHGGAVGRTPDRGDLVLIVVFGISYYYIDDIIGIITAAIGGLLLALGLYLLQVVSTITAALAGLGVFALGAFMQTAALRRKRRARAAAAAAASPPPPPSS